RRPVLLVSIFGTFIGFLLLGFAGALWMLFFSRVIDGLTGGNLTVAQAYITDVTDQKNRTKALGMIGAAFGLGFIIGPAVGGALSVFGYAVPAFVAAGLALINLVAVFFFLPESLTAERRAAIAEQKKPPFTFGALWQALSRPRVGPLLHTRFFFSLAFAMFQSIFALYAQYRLQLTPQTTGYVLAYVGLLSVFTQGFAVGRLANRFSDKQIIFVASIVMAFALLAWAFAPNLITVLIVLAPMSFAGGTLNTVLSSSLTKSVYPEEIGGTLGLAASVESLTRVIAPSAGGFLFEFLGFWAPGVVSAIVMVWVVTFVYRRLIVNPDPPLPLRGGSPYAANTAGL
ncbi:MAG TPA: MFS transporter, partial [Anaerolineae bacterium]|nr:MFS transporter [Anaerolineae bacterium]